MMDLILSFNNCFFQLLNDVKTPCCFDVIVLKSDTDWDDTFAEASQDESPVIFKVNYIFF